MKFEKITENKIKIIVSSQDINTDNISLENIMYNSSSSKKLLQKILNKAEIELNFKTDDSKLLVEAIMESNSEYIFTITKIYGLKAFIYKFDNFDNFIKLCTFLKNFSSLCLNEISQNFSLTTYNGAYYLKYTETPTSIISITYIKNLFSEFATDISLASEFDGILNEYGKIIWEKNAIVECINSFKNKKDGLT